MFVETLRRLAPALVITGSLMLVGQVFATSAPNTQAGQNQPAAATSGDAARVPWQQLDTSTRSMLAPLKKRWPQLSAHAQHHLMARAQQWSKLPEYRQREIRHHIARWHDMTPAERARVRTNQRIFMSLTPAQRAALHTAYEHFQQLPPAQRKKLRAQWHKLTPAQQKSWIKHGSTGDLPAPHHASPGQPANPQPR